MLHEELYIQVSSNMQEILQVKYLGYINLYMTYVRLVDNGMRNFLVFSSHMDITYLLHATLYF